MNLSISEIISKVIVVKESSPSVIVVNKGIKGDSGEAADGSLLSVNNLSDVDNVATARNNLGAISNVDSIVNCLIFG